ncbi:MAG: FAD:protein FMN transferase, partial [Candidatus Omnitrophota bacterium]
MYKVRDIELRRGIEAEKQRVKDLELLEKEEVGRRKAGELELQRDIEAEMQRVNDLDLLRKEEEEAHKARETELCRIIESEKQKVRDLELRRKEAAEKQRARESELRGSFGVERRKAREIELRTKKEADRQGVKEARLQKSIERERKRALDLERRRKKDEEKQKIREIKLQKIIEEEGRKRRETESRLLRGISRRSETSLRQKVAILLVAALALILVIIYTGSRDTAEYSRTVPLMGTFVQIKAYANGLAGKKLPEEVDEALKLARELEKKFSIWDPGSEINKLNIAGMNVVSLELFNLVNKSKRINHVTGGTFDITVAPILKANGFYEKMPAEIRDKIPDDFGGVGIKNVTLKLDNSIWLRNGAWIDLSGIAKGNIVDSMIELFKQKDIENVMINAGGDLYCGNKSGKKPWIVGIREPGSEKILLKLAVRDMAVATSGDYENVVIDKKTGEVMSHIIDPFRDKPLKETYSSVTVIAPECTDADALATGMMVMNKEDAISLADQMKDVSIIVVTISGGKRIVDFSEGAEKYVVER